MAETDYALTLDTALERVKQGVALLNRRAPADWRDRVRNAGPLTRNEMARPYGEVGKCGCIIGRVFGGNFTMQCRDTLGLELELNGHSPIGGEPADCGFTLQTAEITESDAVNNQNWLVLAKAWEKVLSLPPAPVKSWVVTLTMNGERFSQLVEAATYDEAKRKAERLRVSHVGIDLAR